MGIDSARRGEADHIGQPGGIVAEQAFGHAACADDFLPVIEIVHEGVERTDPLLDPARQPTPFARVDDARHHVEGDQPLLGLILSVDIEGDSGPPKRLFGVAMLALEKRAVLIREPFLIPAIRVAHIAIGIVHLVELVASGHGPPIVMPHFPVGRKALVQCSTGPP